MIAEQTGLDKFVHVANHLSLPSSPFSSHLFWKHLKEKFLETDIF